jgi:lipopolysaccharide export system protein LptA
VREDSKGNQFGVATAAPGKLAFFRQKREGVDEFIEGEAELIEYDGEKDLVRFTRQAVMRRLRGAQLADEAVGAVIQYDNTTDVFTVDGGAAQGKAAATGRGRVRVMLTPKPENNLPASAAPAAIATPLKITPTLKERP